MNVSWIDTLHKISKKTNNWFLRTAVAYKYINGSTDGQMSVISLDLLLKTDVPKEHPKRMLIYSVRHGCYLRIYYWKVATKGCSAPGGCHS